MGRVCDRWRCLCPASQALAHRGDGPARPAPSNWIQDPGRALWLSDPDDTRCYACSTALASQRCCATSPWHSRICSGEHSCGSRFFSGWGHSPLEPQQHMILSSSFVDWIPVRGQRTLHRAARVQDRGKRPGSPGRENSVGDNPAVHPAPGPGP